MTLILMVVGARILFTHNSNTSKRARRIDSGSLAVWEKFEVLESASWEERDVLSK